MGSSWSVFAELSPCFSLFQRVFGLSFCWQEAFEVNTELHAREILARGPDLCEMQEPPAAGMKRLLEKGKGTLGRFLDSVFLPWHSPGLQPRPAALPEVTWVPQMPCLVCAPPIIIKTNNLVNDNDFKTLFPPHAPAKGGGAAFHCWEMRISPLPARSRRFVLE